MALTVTAVAICCRLLLSGRQRTQNIRHIRVELPRSLERNWAHLEGLLAVLARYHGAEVVAAVLNAEVDQRTDAVAFDCDVKR